MRQTLAFLPEIYLLVRSDSQRLRTWCFGYSAASATLSPKMKQRAPVLRWKSGAAAVSKVFRTTAKIGGFMPTAHDDANHHRLVHSSISGLQYPRQRSANFAPLAPACKVSRLLHHLNPATLSFLAPSSQLFQNRFRFLNMKGYLRSPIRKLVLL